MKKYLFGTMALSTMLVGCSQEELTPGVNNVETEAQEMSTVVGHDLVGPLTISVGGATRAANGAWQATDKLGLAWFDLEGDITAAQTTNKWNDFVAGTITTDNNIFANHLFSVVDGAFTTQSNVYQGAHFVYFPFERAAKIDQKSVKLNEKDLAASTDEQSDFDYDRFNNVFHISTADYVSATEVNADMQLTKEFTMSPVANVINIEAIPTSKFAAQEKLKALDIASYSITTAAAALADEFDIVTKDIPNANYKTVNSISVLDTEKNIEDLDDYAASIAADPKETLIREIAADYTMAEGHDLPIYALPVDAYTSDNDGVTITINIKTATGLTGYFKVNNPSGLLDNDENVTENIKTINKLDKAMAEGGYLTEILRKNGEWSFLNLPVELSEANFKLNANIENYDQWKDAVEIYDALGATAATFNVVDEVNFAEAIPTLANGEITVETTVDGSINITGEVTLPANDKLDLTSAKVNITTNGTLTIEDEVELPISAVTNNGIINLGYKSQLGSKDNGINNESGRINVIYGSYAYVATGQEGTVAYIVPKNYVVRELAYLIADDNSEGLASVNTFVVGYEGNQQVTLNLNGFEGGLDDPYNPGGNSNMPELDGITMEMTGGIVTKGNGSKTNVKAIKVLSGTNKIENVTVLGDITVSKDAEAYMTGGAANANITNAGTTALMDVAIAVANNTNITNSGTMTINATKTGDPKVATYTASAKKLTNSNTFTVNNGVKTLTISTIVNTESGIITADNKQQVMFSSMQNDGTLVRVTQ